MDIYKNLCVTHVQIPVDVCGSLADMNWRLWHVANYGLISMLCYLTDKPIDKRGIDRLSLETQHLIVDDII